MAYMMLLILTLASLLILANTTTNTVDNSESEHVKHMTIVPKRVKGLEENASSQAEDIHNLANTLKKQCMALEDLQYQNRLQDNALDQRRGVIKIESASQNSNYQYYHASRVINGNSLRSSNLYNGGCSHTGDGDRESWWQAELAYPAIVERISARNRGDCCGYRLNNFQILLLDSANGPKKLCANYKDTVGGGVMVTIVCDTPMTAKYVRLFKKSKHVQLCGFIVEGTPVLDKTMAGATQSSTHPTELESRAWRALNPLEEMCSQTDPDEDGDPWWQMKFEQTTTVSSVTITNRKDAKSKWMKGLKVTVYNTQPTSCPGEEDGGTECTTHDAEVPEGGTVTMTCDQPITGQYMRIEKTKVSNEGLSLCKVVIN